MHLESDESSVYQTGSLCDGYQVKDLLESRHKKELLLDARE